MILGVETGVGDRNLEIIRQRRTERKPVKLKPQMKLKRCAGADRVALVAFKKYARASSFWLRRADC